MMRHGRFVAIAAAVASATAAEECTDNTCQAQGGEESALLQTPISRHGAFVAANSSDAWSIKDLKNGFWCPCQTSGESAEGKSKSVTQTAEQAVKGLGAGCDSVGALKTLKKEFNTIGTRTAPGGVLSHGIDKDTVAEILKRPLWAGQGLPNYRDITDCTANTRHTCGAWAWARRDVAPIAFNFPGAGIRIQILMGASKAWSLTTGAAPFDKNTNFRSACSQQNPPEQAVPPIFGGAGVVVPPCMEQAATAAGFAAGDVLYQPFFDSGTPAANPNCAPDDFRCKLVTSGGCLEHANFALTLDFCQSNANPEFVNWETCFSVQKCEPPTVLPPGETFPTANNYFCVYFSGACDACTSPFMCKLEDVAVPGTPVVSFDPSPADLGPKYEVPIGSSGQQWADQYFDILKIPSEASYQQCGMVSSQTPELKNALDSVYEKVIDLSGLPANRDEAKATAPFELFGDPNNVVFLENEINTYTQSNTFSKEFRDQDEVFFDSIIAIGIDTRTCEEMLAFLDNKFYDIPGFTNAKERCDGYLGGTSRQAEREEIRQAKIQVLELQGRLIAAARKPIPIVKSEFGSNVAPDLTVWDEALKGTVDPDDFFGRYNPIR